MMDAEVAGRIGERSQVVRKAEVRRTGTDIQHCINKPVTDWITATNKTYGATMQRRPSSRPGRRPRSSAWTACCPGPAASPWWPPATRPRRCWCPTSTSTRPRSRRRPCRSRRGWRSCRSSGAAGRRPFCGANAPSVSGVATAAGRCPRAPRVLCRWIPG